MQPISVINLGTSWGCINSIAVDPTGDVFFSTRYRFIWRTSTKNSFASRDVIPCFGESERSYQGIILDKIDPTILWVADYTFHHIFRHITTKPRIRQAFVGNGSAGHKNGHILEATVWNPWGIAQDKNGDLYITESNCIRKICVKEEKISHIAGDTNCGYLNGEASIAKFNRLAGIAITDDNTIFVCDAKNNCIRTIKDGYVSTAAGLVSDEISEDNDTIPFQFSSPREILLDTDGTLLVSDGNGIVRINVQRKIIASIVTGMACFGLASNGEGYLYFGTNNSLMKLKNTWKQGRYFWIGHLKEDASYCELARMPAEMGRPIVIYADLMSQPSRAVIWFCKLNKIPHQIKLTQVAKNEQLTETYAKMFEISKIIDKLTEIPSKNSPQSMMMDLFCLKGLVVEKFTYRSHSILRYLSQKYNAPDHWYPKDVQRRAKIDSYLDWHHTNLRKTHTCIWNSFIGKRVNHPAVQPEIVPQAEKDMKDAITGLDSFWLQNNKFIAGQEVSIADLSATCELEQLTVINYDFTPWPNVSRWLKEMESLEHFDDVHRIVHKVRAKPNL